MAEEHEHTALHDWYDRLRPCEAKSSIAQVKCLEYCSYDQTTFRMIVLCAPPFAEKMREVLSDQISNKRIHSFTDWIQAQGMPRDALLDKRYVVVDWWPIEMLPFIENEPTPQNQAQRDMDNHFLDCLELIRLATIPSQNFADLWLNSNEPFFAAGRIIYGDFKWIQEIPDDFEWEADTETLFERISEYSREYVGLLRLAKLCGAESPLVDRVTLIIHRFRVRYASEIHSWQILAHEFLDEMEEMSPHYAMTQHARYEEIDKACDHLRQNLTSAAKGFEQEFVTLINAVLPTLEVPASSALFIDNDHLETKEILIP